MRETWCIVHNKTVYQCGNMNTKLGAQEWFVKHVIGRGTWDDCAAKGYEAKKFVEAPA